MLLPVNTSVSAVRVPITDAGGYYTGTNVEAALQELHTGSMDHGNLNAASLLDDDHTQYLLIDGTRDMTGSLLPNAADSLDLGASGEEWRTIYAGNDGGNFLKLPDASGSKPVYTLQAGGGGDYGGTLKIQFTSINGGQSAENDYIIDFGPVDFASAEHRYLFQSTGNGPFIGDVLVYTVFGGALGQRNIGITFESTGTFQYYNNFNCKMGPALAVGYDPTSGNNIWKRFEIQFDDDEQYQINSTAGGVYAWHRFDMQPDYMSPGQATYAMMVVDALTDRLSANRTSRFGLRVIPPATDTNGFTLTYAASVAVIGQPTAGTYNAGLFMGNSAKIVLSNTNTGVGPGMWGIIFGADILVAEPNSVNSAYRHVALPSGTSTAASFEVFNQSNVLGGSYGYFQHKVAAAVASTIVTQGGAPTNPITDLDIGGDAAATSFADINFKFLNVTEYNMSATALTFADANNIIVGTGTGTKIGTATSQKLGMWNATPVVQHSTTGQTAGSTVGTGNNVNDDSTFTGGVGTKAYTIGDVVRALKNMGAVAAS